MEIQSQVVMKDANNPPAKRKKPVPMAMQRAKDETAIPTTAFIVEAARAEAIPILPEKVCSTIGEDMPKDKTDE